MKIDPRFGQGSRAQLEAFAVPDMHQTVEQMKDTYERMRVHTEALTEVFRKTCSSAASVSADWSLKAAEAMRSNFAANLEFANNLAAAKTLPDLIEVSTAHARKQMEAAIAQNKELMALTQKLMAEAAKPLTTDLAKTFKPDGAS